MSKKDPKPSSTAALKQKIGDPEANDQPENELMSHEEMQQKLIEAENKAEENWDRVLRMQAEAKNAERRSQLDIQNAHKFALEKFALDLLPIIDNLERAILSHQTDEHGAGTLFDGVELTIKMFRSTLDKFGIQEVNPEGQPFNPEFHQAVSTKESEKVRPNTVLEVLQKGYILNGRLIRPALVIVAK